MLTYEEIMNYCSSYRIENGIVIDKKTNMQVMDEEIILKVKSSVLLFREAKEEYQSDIKQFGKTSRTQEGYIRGTMEKFGVNNENNTFGVNKVINAILSSNGHYEVFVPGGDLQSGKFSILVEPKREYGLAYLKLKFREKGLDIEDLKISQDLTRLQHEGISKVIVDFKVKQYNKNMLNTEQFDSSKQYQHPRATELNELERQKQIAKQNNDKDAYDSAQATIEKIVRESPAEVTPKQWDSMSLSQRISFVKVKIRESKILHDEDEFNYWNSNLKMWEAELAKQTENQEFNSTITSGEPLQVSNPNMSNGTQYQELPQHLEEKKDYKFYFDEMIKAVKKYNLEQNMTEEQKKQLIGEIFYNEGYMVQKLSNDEEIRQLMTLAVNELMNPGMETRLSNIIFSEIQDKYNQLHPEVQKQEKSKEDKNKINNNSSDMDLSDPINQLRSELNKIQNDYHSMSSDGYIDDEELAILISKVNKVINDGYSLKKLATNQKDIRMISTIINTLEEEQSKMDKMQNEIEEINRGMK